MHAGITIGRSSAGWLLLMLALLVCASCNLEVGSEESGMGFEGPPVIHIAAPQPNQTFLAGTTVIVQARVENAGPDLARVAVLLDESLLGERLAPNETGAAVLPLTIDWPTSRAGRYTIAVVADRADGNSARADVAIEVISGQRPTGIPPTEAAISDSGSATALPSSAIPATSPAPTATAYLGPSQVAGKALTVANLRPGPGADTGQPLGSLVAGTEVTIVAVNPARDWYRISYGESDSAWIDASFIEAADVTDGLPVETGEAPLPAEGVNLLITDVRLEPATPICGEAAVIRATVQNAGTLDAQTSPWVSAKAHLLSDQGVVAENAETTVLSRLKAGEETVLEMSIIISAGHSQRQVIRVTVDSGNHVLESNEDDNVGDSPEFELSRGNCA